ncbi:homoserine dehydrogenase [Terribacillus halophilus]|uniref:homoserine dehydrogenase n=1 Tax=Terribacillus halophilus TaxID=361279 RepID=UPI0009875237|nr:homoserine dehydrogenase [Terribacillus halophilus]
MTAVKVGLIGYGTVGSAVGRTIRSHQENLQTVFGKEVQVAGVLVRDKQKYEQQVKDTLLTDNVEEFFAITDLDIIIEASVGIEPAYSYLKKAISSGCHIITANKEMIASKGADLKELAKEKGVRLEYEAAVAGGVPVIGTLKQLLHINHVVKVEAILNGTSNFILSEMSDKNIPFEEALQLAQEAGFAEADPANDVDGWDAFYKLMVLSDLLFEAQPDWEKVTRKGIRSVSFQDIHKAAEQGWKIKHVATLENTGGEVTVYVEPVVLSAAHPLYSVDGVDNAVCIEGNLVGKLKLQGPGAGALPTASAIVEDLANLVHQRKELSVKRQFQFTEKREAAPYMHLPSGQVVVQEKPAGENYYRVAGKTERLVAEA